MPWYVIQTYTGNEEKLVEMIRRMVPKAYYSDCFMIYHEQLRQRQQENQIHVLRLFPGYIFISSDEIDLLFRCLKKVPAMSKIMASDDFAFTPLGAGEAEFLLEMMDEDHIVRLSYVATDGRDHVTYVSGPLEKCRGQIQRYQFRKRYAAVRLRLEGQEKEVKLGIILNDDIRREIAYGKVEAPVGVPGRYTIQSLTKDSGDVRKKAEGHGEGKKNVSGSGDKEVEESSGECANECTEKKTGERVDGDTERRTEQFKTGDRVIVVEGAFEGSVASVSQVKKDTLKISVQMFGREIRAEVPAESVKKVRT